LFDQTLIVTEATAAVATVVARLLDRYLAGMPQSVAELRTCIESDRICGKSLDYFTMLYSDAQYARFDVLRNWARGHDINSANLDRLVDVQGPPKRSPLDGVEEIHLTVAPAGDSYAVTKTGVVMRSKRKE
jgi:hypothetical protein